MLTDISSSHKYAMAYRELAVHKTEGAKKEKGINILRKEKLY